MDVFTIFSHLALTTSSSLSFYIYYGKYGSPNKGVHQRIGKLRNALKIRRVSFISDTNTNRYSEDIHLPDMNTLDIRKGDETLQYCSEGNHLQ